MEFIEKLLQIKQGFLREKTSLIISAALTLPSALLISIIFYSFNSKPYSIFHLLRATIILTWVLFWVIWWIVSRNKQYLITISKRFLSSHKDLIAAGFFLSFFFLLITAELFSPFDFTQMNFLTKPNYRYLIEIEPDKGNPGNICIMEIKNSYGNVFKYNETVLNTQNSGLWKRNVYGCEHFIGAGEIGKISFENIGPIDDVIQILALSNPLAGDFVISAQPGSKRIIQLWSREENNTHINLFHPINNTTRNVINWVLNFGIFSVFLVIFLLILEACYIIFKKYLDHIKFPKLTGLFGKFRLICNVMWSRLDSKAATIITISILYIAGVIFSVYVTKPLAYGPSHFNDEIYYWNIALNIFKGTYPNSASFYNLPPFYPILLLPAFFLFYPSGTYTAAKLLNALYITSAIIPIYLLLRKFIKRNLSIIAITILLLNPVQLIMPARILSENIFYPLFMWTVLFAFTNVWSASQKNRVFECLILGLLLGLLFLTRYIAVALLPAFLFIWWLKPFEHEKLPLLFSIRKFLHLIIILFPLILIIGGWLNFGLAEGLSANARLGLSIADSPNPDQLSFGRLVMWMVFYCSYTILIAAPYLPILLASLSRFKLRDWQEDSNRWKIALAAIVLFFLTACIRHSWRINYNYPIPLTLQGRYILYFGSLFLITIFISLDKAFKSVNCMKLIIYSSAMILAAYAFLFLGFIYLDGPLGVGVSSPDGYLIEYMGISFITLTLTNIIFNSLLINRKRITLITSVVLFLTGFFTYGNVKIFLNELPSQLNNSQIYNLVQEYRPLSSESIDKEQPPLTIFIPKESSTARIRSWRETLKFNGFTDITMRKSNIAEVDPAVVLQAGTSDHLINLRELTETEFLLSENKKFSLSGKFFEFQVMPNN